MPRDDLRTNQILRAGYRLALSDPKAFFLLGFALLAHGATIVLAGPAMVGAAMFAARRLRGDPVELGVFYRGFSRGGSPYYASLVLAGIVLLPVGACLTAAASVRWLGGDWIGWILSLPFLALMVLYFVAAHVLHLYLFHALAEDPEDLWGAFERARELVASRPVEHVILVLYLVAMNLTGALACGIGLLLTAPVSFCAVSVAYRLASGRAPARAAPPEKKGPATAPEAGAAPELE